MRDAIFLFFPREEGGIAGITENGSTVLPFYNDNNHD